MLTWLQSILGMTVHYSRVPEDQAAAFCWFERRSINWDPCLSDGLGTEPASQNFDVELWGLSPDATAAAAKLLRNEQYFRGAMGNAFCRQLIVNDQSDDYTPRGGAALTAPDDWFVATFDLLIFERG